MTLARNERCAWIDHLQTYCLWINWLTISEDFKMQVRSDPGMPSVAGFTDGADDRALSKTQSRFDADVVQVRIEAVQMVSMLNLYKSTQPSMESDLHDDSAADRMHGTVECCHKIDPAMVSSAAAWSEELSTSFGIVADRKRPRVDRRSSGRPIDVRQLTHDRCQRNAEPDPNPK